MSSFGAGRALGLALVVFLSGPALAPSIARASDGVIELNQTCATQTGCAPGDAPGFPITLMARGSYRLTSDLEVPNANTDGIKVGADDVTLDFNGFTLVGPGFVPITTHVCSPPVDGLGISPIDPAAPAALVVQNGRIRGMGSGIFFPAANAHVERMIVERNCLWGIYLGTAGLVVDSQVRANGGAALTLGTGGRVRDSIADNNGGSGMILGSGGVVTGSIATTNLGEGIEFSGTGGVASGNSLVGNGGSGLVFTRGGVANGNTVYTNHWDGITVLNGAVVVVENSAGENHQKGIFGSGSSGHGLNALDQNTAGGFSYGTPIACNVVDGVKTCP